MLHSSTYFLTMALFISLSMHFSSYVESATVLTCRVSIHTYRTVIKVTERCRTSLFLINRRKGVSIMLQRHSPFWNVIIFLVGVFVPIVGHILDTILILRSDHSWAGKALWLVVVWLLPFVVA